MKKLALILGMFIALTFMSMNSVQAETSTWTINYYSIQDTNEVYLEEHPDIEPFVMTVVARYEEGDYGTIELANATQTKYSLTDLIYATNGSNYKTFYFEGIDEQSVGCLFTVTFYYKDRNFHVYLSVGYSDKILNWTGKMLELEDPGIEI